MWEGEAGVELEVVMTSDIKGQKILKTELTMSTEFSQFSMKAGPGYYELFCLDCLFCLGARQSLECWSFEGSGGMFRLLRTRLNRATPTTALESSRLSSRA